MRIRRWRCWPIESPQERELLGTFRYSRNLAVLHTDDEFHAEAAGGMVELELRWLPECHARRRLRDLLDEPPAKHRER